MRCPLIHLAGREPASSRGKGGGTGSLLVSRETERQTPQHDHYREHIGPQYAAHIVAIGFTMRLLCTAGDR